ncbi:hypothetical protein SAMN04487947_4121 [Halogeometricum rufum]|jgi:hypothetical protein|uniref:Halobacterial output domain-containing protein n=1 Tax=Halogeometricum rufum TaxID=553469 RepID=A0A1I6J7Y4_9EURY|nr:HalOD1 output domain-containing protein [Halogeometricum rufum]SFR74630.1 hypothetical protein SAMN04487947_4121 [Halogeometricum rufum]
MRAQTENWWEQRIDYDDGAESYHVAYERSELVSTNVVLSVAAIENVEPTELPPLASTIDPDALDSLFVEDVSGRISFSYAGYDVTIHAGGRLEIVPSVDIARRQQRN